MEEKCICSIVLILPEVRTRFYSSKLQMLQKKNTQAEGLAVQITRLGTFSLKEQQRAQAQNSTDSQSHRRHIPAPQILISKASRSLLLYPASTTLKLAAPQGHECSEPTSCSLLAGDGRFW